MQCATPLLLNVPSLLKYSLALLHISSALPNVPKHTPDACKAPPILVLILPLLNPFCSLFSL
jgi:hypothetical protein